MTTPGKVNRHPNRRRPHPLEVLLGIRKKTNQKTYRKNPHGQLFVAPKQRRKK